PITPPDANGVSPVTLSMKLSSPGVEPLVFPTPPLPLPKTSPSNAPSPLVRFLASGWKAWVTAIFESRKPSCLSTSSNCLPPVVASAKALLIALEKLAALMPSAFVLPRTFSVAPEKSPNNGPLSEVLSSIRLIRICPHQFAKREAIKRRAAAGDRFEGAGELARRHRPELLRRQPQHAEAKADRPLPRKGHHAFPSPKVTAMSSAAIRT